MRLQGDTSQQDLLSIYADQPREVRRILQLFSVIYEPVGQTVVKDILKGLGWKSADGRGLHQLLAKPLRVQLLGLGLLVDNCNKYHIALEISEQFTRELVDDGSFELVVNVVEKHYGSELVDRYGSPLYRLSTHQREQRLMRCIRIALHRNEGRQLTALLGLSWETFPKLTLNKSQPLLAIGSSILDLKWFASRSMTIQYLIARAFLLFSSTNLVKCPELSKVMESAFRSPQNEPAPACLLAEFHLLRGAPSEALLLLEGVESAESMALKGCCYCLLGEGESALVCFDSTIKAIKSGSRKRNVYVEGRAGVLHIITLIITGEKSNYQLAEKLVSMRMKASNKKYDEYMIALFMLNQTLSILDGTMNRNSATGLLRGYEQMTLWDDLLRAVMLYWTGSTLSKKLLDKIADYGQRAHGAGWGWYAAEAGQVLTTSGCLSDIPPPQNGLTPLVEQMKPEQEWERVLRNLKALNSPVDEADQQVAGNSGLRMSWRIDTCYGDLTLEPREQRITKSGKWSKGRAVSLRRLHDEREEFEYLTPEDHRICDAIKKENDLSGWGYHQSFDYTLHSERAIRAAAEHPLLFRADDPGQHVELVFDEPALVVRQSGEGIHLCLTPDCDDIASEHGGLMMTQEERHRIHLVQFQPQHVRISELLGVDGLQVPASARQQVLDTIGTIAPLLSVHSEIGGGQTDTEEVAADPRLRIQLHPVGDGLRLECFVRPFGEAGPLFHPESGASTIFTEVEGKSLQTTRGKKEEGANAEKLFDQCPALMADEGWSWSLDEPAIALETLEQLQELTDEVVLEWPQGKQIRLQQGAGMNQMQLTVTRQKDWFELDGSLQLEESQVIDMKRLLSLLEHSEGRFIKLGEGEFLAITQELHHRLESIRRMTDGGKFHTLAAPLMEEVTEGMELKSGKAWRQQLQRLEQAEAFQPEIPSTLQAELRDYQIEGYNWLARLAHWGAGACLADDMGLGKTLQALTLILTRAPDGPTLILAPTSVSINWLSETKRFAPTLNPKQFGPGDRQQMLDEAGPYDLIVCSYGLLQTENERLAQVKWHTLVADEAQAIKNSMTKRSKAAMALTADYKIITTGTPIENHLGELWNLFHFINPGLLGSQQQFNQRFAAAIENSREGAQAARQHLKMLIRPFILRRLKNQVLDELPAKTEITLQVELGREEQLLYEAMRQQAMERLAEPVESQGQQLVRTLTEITRLRQVCCNPLLVLPGSTVPSAKLQAFAEIVQELRENRHKALVFSQFVGHLKLLRKYLDEQGIHYQYLDGSTPLKKREIAVNAFQRGEGDLFLISLKAGGSGLNLTAADYVIHMDPWWNPAVEDQASDRAHRIGQTRPVTIYRLVAKGTIEEMIIALHSEKRDLADSLLEGSEASGKISAEQMMALIKEAGLEG